MYGTESASVVWIILEDCSRGADASSREDFSQKDLSATSMITELTVTWLSDSEYFF